MIPLAKANRSVARGIIACLGAKIGFQTSVVGLIQLCEMHASTGPSYREMALLGIEGLFDFLV